VQLKVITREGVQVEQEASEVSLPVQGGRLQVLNDHTDAILQVEAGDIQFNGSRLAVGPGLAHIVDHEMTIFAEGVRGRVRPKI